MDVKSTIEKLKKFDLEKVSIDDVRTTIEELGQMAILRVIIHPGHSILRGRSDFTYIYRRKEEEISYIKDPNIIPKYNRASLEGEICFYGVLEKDDDNYNRALSTYEITSLTDDSIVYKEDQEEYITMARWIVEKEIHLAVIAYKHDFHDTNPHLKNLHESYIKYVEQYPDFKEDFINIVEFLADEFAKPVKNNERYNYKISAMFSKIIMEYGLDGIMYPTAKDEGKIFNVAIKPSVVDKCLKIEKSIVFRLVRRDKKIVIEPYLFCDKIDETGEFVWLPTGSWLYDGIADKILNQE